MRSNVTSDNLIIPLNYGSTPGRCVGTNAGRVETRIEKWS